MLLCVYMMREFLDSRTQVDLASTIHLETYGRFDTCAEKREESDCAALRESEFKRRS